jgi:hypothetical protein
MNQGNNKMGSYSGSSDMSEDDGSDLSQDKDDARPIDQKENLKKINFLED